MGVLMARPLGRCTDDAVLNAVDLNTRARIFVAWSWGVWGMYMERFWVPFKMDKGVLVAL
jgi:hypothetical protein